ncbi:MAG: calcium-binding protein, partial [Rhodobacterales bacterium]
DGIINDTNGNGFIDPGETPLLRTQYDNELLDRHFITGDGRGNENIGLTAVHHVFHQEHNRQVAAQKLTILDTGDLNFINEWLADDISAADLAGYAAMTALQKTAFADTLGWDGERLFQAGRFATEMQYQHLVFEEFARKIHPNIDPFIFNNVTDINPAIFAEFANVVYRFGHSMLTDSMPRVFADGSTDDMGLIASFLNPVAYDNDTALTADEAAAAVIRGMTVERGNAMDEFIVGSLRNNLVGLPLDLAAINIARGRDTGMPSFNEARAQLFAQTGSSWLKPYATWAELAANLKNPMTIVNLIAAYGTHADIVAATTLEGKRTVAFNLVFGSEDYSFEERRDFLHGRGQWTAETSGLNDIDLWVGGLAERIMPFGGMLGSTFTAIFEAQMESLQFGDRFYYLSRTQGQNFLNELEQNSFSKMLLANTSLAQPGADGIRGTSDDIITHHIGVDAFAKYDFVLEVNKLNQLVDDPTGIDPLLEAIGLGKVVRDDPTTDEVETNYLRFTGGEHVVVGGTADNDTIITDDGDDGIWGDAGDDFIQSGFGVDLVNGGAGNDIILDAGDEADFLKGEEGDDVMGTSSGLDILMGGKGKDVIFLGADASEIFGGEGDDFIMGGEGADFLMGNEGNDWIEGGNGFDGIAGDNTELFFNSRIIGHDVMFAGSEEQDFDAESGDDIMVQGESVMRNEGMFGFDWVSYKGVQTAADADMRIKIFTTEEQDILRNRFDKVEGLSGWEKDDQLRGDDRVSGTADIGVGAGANEGIFDRDGLDQAGIDRIAGLSDLVTLASEQLTWDQGNILLGGGGSDSLTGGGGNDILDGDRWLNVRIRITETAGAENTEANEIATVDTLKHIFTATDGVDPSWVGKSLFELLVARVVVPAQMHIVREILDGATEGDVDVAVFGDDRAQYTITQMEDGSVRVSHTGFGNNADVLVDDGTDTLHNIEVLRFRDGDFTVEGGAAIGVPAISDSTPLEGQALTVNLDGIEGAVGPITVQWRVSEDGTTWTNIPGATSLSFTPEDLAADVQGAQTGLLLQVVATYTNAAGQIVTSTSSATAPVGWNWAGLNGDRNDFSGTEGDDVAVGGDDRDRLEGNGGADSLSGGAGRDRILGGDGNDTLDGGDGEDRVIGGNGDDMLVVNFASGAGAQDTIEGDLGTDTLVITDTALGSTFTILTRAEAELRGIALGEETSEIVITRNGLDQASVIAEIATIEEIVINTTDVTANDGDGGLNGGDTITIIGDFSTTSLSYSTIRINGSDADDTVDISGFASAHRIVFRSAGGNDTIVGNIRAQDVIDLPGTGETSVTHGANGMVTVSRGGASVTFDGSGAMPSVPGLAEDDDAADGGFFLTASDLAGLKNLVNGRPAFDDDDDTAGVTGVRTLSGEGNNVDNPLYGTAGQSFIRLTDARYGEYNPATGNRDINPIFDGLDPREISNILGDQEVGLAKSAVNANILFMAFGQYFDHGLDFLPKSSANGMIEIGGPGMSRGPGSDNPADLTRAKVDYIDANGVPQHENMTSPFVDQNQAYGSHELVGQFLRESDGEQGYGMRLLQGEPDPSDPDFTLLPTLRDVILHHWEANTIFRDPGLPGGAVAFQTAYAGLVDGTGVIDAAMVRALAGNFLGSGQPLLLDTNPFINLLDHRVAGDGRANENFALTSIHTIWARNHNFHVENLIDQGFVGTAEEVYQAAKMLNESDYQRVVFQEFADKLIGGIRSADGGNDNHGWDGYNDEVDSRISHEFASAVYRVGHSLIGQTLQVMGADGQPIEVPLFDAFLNPTNAPSAFTGPLPPGYVPQPGYAQHGVAAIMEGTATQLAEEVDFNIVDAVRNDLVRINADLFAFNVARGWDVGLGTLNQVRAGLAASNNLYIAQAVGLAGDLSPYTSWDDFQDRNGLSDAVIAQFKAAYPDLVLSTAEDIAAFTAVNPDIVLLDGPNGTKIVKGIDRVDLWVGGLAEQHINGGMVGQTFWVVLHEQLDRLQEGDRFYYLDRFENFDFYGTFGEDTTFANIIARNTSLTGLDSSIFDAVNDAEEEEDEDGEDNDDDGDTDNDGDNDDDGDNDGDTDSGGDTDSDDDGDTDEDTDDTDEDDDEDTDNDDDDVDSGTDGDVGLPPLAASGIIAGTANGEALFGT